MATIVSNSTTTNGDNVVLAASQDVVVLSGVNLSSEIGDGIVANLSSHSITVQGQVFGGANGIEMETTDFTEIYIGQGGTVTGGDVGIEGEGSGNRIVNEGAIFGFNGGIEHFPDNDFTLVNHGTITSVAGAAVEIRSENTNVNYGAISGAVGVSTGVVGGASTHWINHGSITGTEGEAFNGDSGDPDLIENFGTFTGDVNVEGGDNTVVNAGTITGDILAEEGMDVVRNTGLVSGVSVGSGDGADILAGNDGNDDLKGDDGGGRVGGLDAADRRGRSDRCLSGAIAAHLV